MDQYWHNLSPLGAMSDPKRVRVPKNEKDKIQGELVRVFVGNQEEVFNVHENLIRASSPFFDKAMSGPWQEPAQRTIQLPDDEPEMFGIYVHWLYYGTLPVFTDQGDDTKSLDIVKAYTFGDKVLDTRFQNTAIYALVETCTTPLGRKKSYPGPEAIQHVYNNTSESALIRKLFVDIYIHAARDTWLLNWKEQGRDIPQPFLFDLASKLLGQQNRPRPYFIASDYYIRDLENLKASPDKRGS